MKTRKIQIVNSLVPQPDWGQTDETKTDYIKNKPNVNVFSNALKGSASGAVVALNDVSPVEHEIECMVKSENLLDISDFSAVKVKQYGKNMSNIMSKGTDGVITLSGGKANAGMSYPWNNPNRDNVLMPAGTYTISCDYKNVGNTQSPRVSIYTYEYGDTTYTKIGSANSAAANGHLSFTMTLTEAKYIRITLQNNATSTVYADGEVAVSFSNVQVEAGNKDTGYEAYVVPVEYSVNNDGRVYGLLHSTSLTLATDTAGILIECTYNRDINKAFEELVQAIISLGGNI